MNTIHVSPRPPGHITSLVRDLKGWMGARRRKNLRVKELEAAIAYLEEYRELRNAVMALNLRMERINGTLTLRKHDSSYTSTHPYRGTYAHSIGSKGSSSQNA